MSDKVEPLSKDEEKTLRDVAFFLALDRVLVAAKIRNLLSQARQLAEDRCHEYDAYKRVSSMISEAEDIVPWEIDKFAEAFGIVAEDTEFVDTNEYHRLRCRLNGVALDPDECRAAEHPADVLKKLGGLLSKD